MEKQVNQQKKNNQKGQEKNPTKKKVNTNSSQNIT